MKTEPTIQEIDLIKIKVIKKKHIEGLRTNYKADFSKLQMLAYITEWDSILYQNLETKHYGVANATSYYSSLEREGINWLETYKKAQEFVHSLPQLFLD